MGILLPEKIIMAVLASGLETIKGDTDEYIPKVFDEDTMGSDFITKAAQYLTGNKVKIAQGYNVDDARLPGWYVVPASVAPAEDFIGDYITEDEYTGEETEGSIYEGIHNNFQARVVSASANGDATMILEALARYILLSARETMGDKYGLHELNVTATDMDPIYQFMPQNLYYRSTVLSFRGLNTWEKEFTIIKTVEIFGKFNADEDFVEI